MAKKFASDSPTWDEIKQLKKPATKTVWISLDSDLVARIEQLERQIPRERVRDNSQNRDPIAPPLEAELAQLRQRAEDDSVPFTMKAISRRRYDELVAAHPSDQTGEAFDVDTFGPALIAACCASPELTEAAAAELWEEWSPAEVVELFNAAYAVCNEMRGVPFGRPATAATSVSESPSTTALLEE